MKSNNTIIIIFHIILGYFSFLSSTLLTFWAWSIFIIGFFLTLKSKNKSGEAHLFAGYIMGLEVLLRMTGTSTFWEFGKYGVIALLGLGLIIESTPRRLPKSMLLFILLLLPSIILNDSNNFQIWKQQISSNISGPFCLAIAALYFHKKEFNRQEITRLFFVIILPIISMAVIIMSSQGNFSDIVFGNIANFQTSGGFGPNQVATILGLGVVIVGLSILLKLSIMKRQIYNYLLLGLFTIFGLLTFSRGGMIAAIFALGIGWLLYFFQKRKKKLRNIFRGIVIIILLLFVWNIISDLTDGAISTRYASVIDEEGKFNFTNRLKILQSELEIFNDNFWFGVGAGQSKFLHIKYSFGRKVATHTEFGRMLAEHGFLGIINILILIFLPLNTFYNENMFNNRILSAVFVSLAFITMLHSAMRLAMPGFVYGLAMIRFKEEQ